MMRFNVVASCVDPGVRRFWRRIGFALLITVAMPVTSRAQHRSDGIVYYLDGAGGGGWINWGRGIKAALRDAGYDGEFEHFSWQTQLGFMADQKASSSYKRKNARKLAQDIQEFRGRNPAAPVTLIGLSAGTAILVFVLEALPSGVQVDNAILLASSVSHDYDLTIALSRVRGRMHVFTSYKDPVLRYFVPLAGTADGEHGSRPAGLRGFKLPPGASSATRSQYGKLSHVQWSSDLGMHTDVVRSSFVKGQIAPLVMRAATDRPAIHAQNPEVETTAYRSFGGERLSAPAAPVPSPRSTPSRPPGQASSSSAASPKN